MLPFAIEAYRVPPLRLTDMLQTMKDENTNTVESTGDASAAPKAQTETVPQTAADAAAPALTPVDIEELKAKAAKADEYWDRLLRLAADADNYKRRMTRERQEASRAAVAGLLEKLALIADNFDMALVAAANNATVESLKTGVDMIYSQLKSALVEAGLEEIQAVGLPFDPNWHEAISHQDSTEAADGQVLAQTRKGYKFRDRLLRPASVIVARKPVA